MIAAPLAAAAVGAAAFVAAALTLAAGPTAIARLTLCGAALGATLAFDLAEHRIPNRLVLPATAGCAALGLTGGGYAFELLAGLALVVCLLAVSLLAPAALGMGDVKLALLLVVGLDGRAPRALVLGFLLAAIFAAVVLLRHGRAAGGRALPLAPFLATGSLLALTL